MDYFGKTITKIIDIINNFNLIVTLQHLTTTEKLDKPITRNYSLWKIKEPPFKVLFVICNKVFAKVRGENNKLQILH